MCDRFVVAQAELSTAPPGRMARLILDPGDAHADAEVAAVTRDLADGVLSRVEMLLADRGTDLPVHLRGALIGLADALAERSGGGATVTVLDTPLARAWRTHPAAGRGR